LDHTGVIAELGSPAADMPGPGKARYTFGTLGEFYAVLARVYALGVSLPDAPLQEFQQRTESLPKTTEAERLVVQRIGQDIFRIRLMDYWQRHCPLTGITEPTLLRASHIVPWAECESDAKRLDVHNGLLLSALWDAAFDAGLVSFDDDGKVIGSPSLSLAAVDALNLRLNPTLQDLTEAHRANLAWHRRKYGLEIDRRVAEPARDS
jgi:predicted restriction endonuclease